MTKYLVTWHDGKQGVYDAEKVTVLVPSGLTKQIWDSVSSKAKEQGKTIINLDHVRTIVCVESEE